MITAHNIPRYKLINVLYHMQAKGSAFADIRIEDDFNVVLRVSEINFKNQRPPPLPDKPREDGEVNLEDLI